MGRPDSAIEVEVGQGPTTEAATAPATAAAAPATSPLSRALLQRKIQRRAAARAEAAGGGGEPMAAVEAASRSSGAPVDGAVRQRVEATTGADLGGVRVHTGSASSQAAASLDARAYTVGQDIHFGAGQYDTSSSGGQHLIAHELAHTVQQRGAAAPSTQTKLEVSQPGDAHEVEADRVADAAVAGGGHAVRPHAVTTVARAILQRDTSKPAAPPPAPTPTKATMKSAAELKALTLEALKRYSDEQIDWANNPALTDPDRELAWRWIGFAKENDGNLAGCGKMLVSDLQKTAPTDDKRAALSAYGGTISSGRASARITTPAKNVAQMIEWGQKLVKLEESMGGPTVNRIVDDTAWALLTSPKKTSLVDEVIKYNNACNPVLAADGVKGEIVSISAMLDEAMPYAAYKTTLPEVKNYHRFLDEGLKKVAANKGDKSKSKPFTLVLHTAMDHNGAFHRDPYLKDVLADPRNLTLMIEGAEKLADIQARIGPLANEYGIPGADKKGKIDQVMIAGHGNSTSIELTGKMEMGEGGDMEENSGSLETKDPASIALLDEILKNMDPASPNHKVVFNSCLTNSNHVSSAQIEAAVAKGKTPAEAVKAAMAADPSFTQTLLDRAQALGINAPPSKTGTPPPPAIVAVGANNSIGNVPLQDGKTGALDLKDPNDPATGTKLEYVEFGEEPTGVMRAVVESWAIDKKKTLDAMTRRATATTAKTWRWHLIRKIYDIILNTSGYSDNIVLINDFATWAEWMGEGLQESQARVGKFTPPASVQKHMVAVTSYVLSKSKFAGHFPLVIHETQLVLGLGTAAPFLDELAAYNCQTADQFLDDAELMKVASQVVGSLDSKHLKGQLVVALLNVVHNETPNATAKAFLLANGVSSDKLNSTASALLAGKMSEEKVLARLGIGSAAATPSVTPSATAAPPKANADPDGNKKNEIHVEPYTAVGEATWPWGDVEVRAAPDEKAKSVGKLADGTTVKIVGRIGKEWYAIQHNLQVAYVSWTMVFEQKQDKPQPYAAKGVVSNPFGAPVLAAPDNASPPLLRLKFDDTVTIVARSEDWFTIAHNHKVSYVSRWSVDAVKKKLALVSAFGKMTREAVLWDSYSDAKSKGKIAKDESVEVLASSIDEGMSVMNPGGSMYAIKRSDGFAWVDMDAIKLST